MVRATVSATKVTFNETDCGKTNLLLTRKVSLKCPNQSGHIDATSFFGNGCQLSTISQSLAEKLQLVPINYVDIDLTTLSNTERVNAPRYKIEILSEDNKIGANECIRHG